MRAEIRDRLAEKVPLAVIAQPQLIPVVETPTLTVDNRCYLKLRTPQGEFEITVPENVAYSYKARYGRAPGFPKWFLERVRDLLNAS